MKSNNEFENWWNVYNKDKQLDLTYQHAAYEAWIIQQRDIDKLQQQLDYYKGIVDRTSSKWHLVD